MKGWMHTPLKPFFQSNGEDAERAHTARVRCLEVLAASILRELNEPLSAFLVNAQTCFSELSTRTPDLERARESVRLAIHDAQSAGAVATRFWSLFGKAEVSSEAVDLNKTAREALALSSHSLQRRGVIVRSELEPDLPPITGDSSQLQHVILSLLMNAAEAMNEVNERTRYLELTTQKAAGHVRLSIRDTGHGFAPDAADRLFDAFYTTRSEAMGIGLFISRWIIDCHGGAIHATLNDGPGATFSFQIPCRPAPQARAPSVGQNLA